MLDCDYRELTRSAVEHTPPLVEVVFFPAPRVGDCRASEPGVFALGFWWLG